MKNSYCFPTAIGDLTAVAENGALTMLTLGKGGHNKTEDPLLLKTEEQINEYLAGARADFEIPLKPGGTPFQKQVWDALIKINYGKTVCYEEIAVAIGKPSSSRAVGNAVGANPILLMVPCHRIIKKNGQTGNFGSGPELKKWLLRLESSK